MYLRRKSTGFNPRTGLDDNLTRNPQHLVY